MTMCRDEAEYNCYAEPPPAREHIRLEFGVVLASPSKRNQPLATNCGYRLG